MSAPQVGDHVQVRVWSGEVVCAVVVRTFSDGRVRVSTHGMGVADPATETVEPWQVVGHRDLDGLAKWHAEAAARAEAEAVAHGFELEGGF